MCLLVRVHLERIVPEKGKGLRAKSIALPVRETATVADVIRAALSKACAADESGKVASALGHAEMDDAALLREFALVSVLTESGGAVCTFADPLRQCMKRRRGDNERVELWRRPSDEQWERLARHEGEDGDDETAFGTAFLRTRSRPSATLTVPPTHVIALHDYEMQEDDEMDLHQGEIVRVWYRGADHDWWSGVRVGKLLIGESGDSDDGDESGQQIKVEEFGDEDDQVGGLFPSSFCNGVPRRAAEETGGDSDSEE